MKLTGRRLDIATNGGGLPPKVASAYRENWARWGYELPEWQGPGDMPEYNSTPIVVKPVDTGTPGVGSIITATLRSWGIKETDCTCRNLSKKMDENGPQWCRDNLEMLTSSMIENAKKHKWMRFAPFKWTGAQRLIERSIEKYEEAERRRKRGDKIVWAVGITTAPRKIPTLMHAVLGAKLNGWEPTIFAEPDSPLDGIGETPVVQNETRLGIWWNWVHAAQRLLDDNPDATHILTLQDDCVLVPNAKNLIEEFIPTWPVDCGLVSLYLPSKQTPPKRKRVVGIRPIKDRVFEGSLAVVYQRERLEKILAHRIGRRWGQSNRITHNIVDDDICVGYIVRDMRLKLYYAFPSCSQHISPVSTRGNWAATGGRAANYVATDAWLDCRPGSESDPVLTAKE